MSRIFKCVTASQEHTLTLSPNPFYTAQMAQKVTDNPHAHITLTVEELEKIIQTVSPGFKMSHLKRVPATEEIWGILLKSREESVVSTIKITQLSAHVAQLEAQLAEFEAQLNAKEQEVTSEEPDSKTEPFSVPGELKPTITELQEELMEAHNVAMEWQALYEQALVDIDRKEKETRHFKRISQALLAKNTQLEEDMRKRVLAMAATIAIADMREMQKKHDEEMRRLIKELNSALSDKYTIRKELKELEKENKSLQKK